MWLHPKSAFQNTSPQSMPHVKKMQFWAIVPFFMDWNPLAFCPVLQKAEAMCTDRGKSTSLLRRLPVLPASPCPHQVGHDSSLCLLLASLAPGRSNGKCDQLNRSYFSPICVDSGRIPYQVLAVPGSCVIPASCPTVADTRVSLRRF